MTIILSIAVIVFLALAIRLEFQRRKYRALWIAEARRHADARLELSQWIETSRVSGDAYAHYKSTIARLKMEVAQTHDDCEARCNAIASGATNREEAFKQQVAKLKMEVTRLHEQNDELREIVRVERSHPPETFPAFVGIKVEPTE